VVGPLPKISASALQELRMKYTAAYEAYKSCVQALTAAGINGDKPSAELLGSEMKAIQQLTEARAHLLAAMASG
jgi:hypothetical protein